MPKPATFDHLKKRKPRQVVVSVCVDSDAVAALEAATTDEERATAQQVVEEATETLTFRSIGRQRWEALINEHPPTATQLAEAEKAGEPVPAYDTESFAVAAVAACSLEPKLTATEAKELYDDWNASEFGALYMAVVGVNSSSNVGALGNGSGEIRN